MRLFIKKDNSMVHSRFIITDSSGRTKYVVTGKSGDAVHKMAISSVDGEVLLRIRFLISKVLSTFMIKYCDEHFTIISSGKDNLEPRIHGIPWCIRRYADFRSFDVVDAEGALVMTQIAESFASNGYYSLDIFLEWRELLCLAIAVCMDSFNLADSVVAATV